MEKYITKGEDILTRVTLKIKDGNTYVKESPYCDTSLLDFAMDCIKAYLTDLKIDVEELHTVMKDMVTGKQIPYNQKYAIHSDFEFIFEQYDKREVVKSSCGFNIIQDLLSAMKSCAVLASFDTYVVNDYLMTYLDDEGVEIDKEIENNSKENE